RRLRQLAAGDPIGPIRIHRERTRAAHLREAGAHRAARLTGLNAAIPCGRRILERAERFRDLSRRLATELMARRAGIGRNDVANPSTLTLDFGSNAVAGRPRA